MIEKIVAAYQILINPSQRKHFFRWVFSFKNNYFLAEKQPWLVFDAIDFLNSLALENKNVFEYGSGGSTLYWFSRNMSVVSVEHDPHWYDCVSKRIKSQSKVDYRLIRPELNQLNGSTEFSDPNSYASEDPKYLHYTFRNYVSQIDTFPDNFFDVILIDGRARPSCIMQSYRKVKVNGLLILDNSDRSYYMKSTTHFLNNFSCIQFLGFGPGVGHQWRTDIFFRQS